MITIAKAKLRQIEILQKVLVAVETGVSMFDGESTTYLCHEMCEAYSPKTDHWRERWDHDEVTVLGPLRNTIEVAIHHMGTVECFLGGGTEDAQDNMQERAKQFRIDLVKMMLADRGVEV